MLHSYSVESDNAPDTFNADANSESYAITNTLTERPTEDNYVRNQEMNDEVNGIDSYQDELSDYLESDNYTNNTSSSDTPIQRKGLKRGVAFDDTNDKPKYPKLDYSEDDFLSSERGYEKLKDPHFKQNYLSNSQYSNSHRNFFQGNQNYYRFFQNETKEFLNFGTDNSYPSLIGTYITLPRKKIIPKAIRKTNGKLRNRSSFWSSREKNLFFELLARYSIHQVDLITTKLPNKSIFEVLNYYELLKSETKKWKRKKKYQLVSTNEMPRSYEMSEEFILFEESQAAELQRISTRRTHKKNTESLIVDPVLYSEDEGLINLKELENMGEAMILNKRTQIPPSILKLFGEFTIGYTKKLLLNLIQCRGNKQGFCFPLSISRREIIQVIEKLNKKKEIAPVLGDVKLDESNFNDDNSSNIPSSRKIAERLLTNEFLPQTQDYEQAQIDCDTLKKVEVEVEEEEKEEEEDVEDGDETTPGEDLEDGLIDEMTSHNLAIDHPLSIDVLESFQTKKEDECMCDERDHPFQDPNDSLYSQFSYNKENESFMKTFLMETSMLNLLDHEASLKYEHILLNYMTSDPELVRFNDLDVCTYYVLSAYYPEALGIYNGTSADFQNGGNALVGYRNIDNDYQGLYFNEENPFTIPDYDDVSNEMVFDMSYNYSFY